MFLARMLQFVFHDWSGASSLTFADGDVADAADWERADGEVRATIGRPTSSVENCWAALETL